MKFTLFNPNTNEMADNISTAKEEDSYTITLPDREKRSNNQIIIIKSITH